MMETRFNNGLNVEVRADKPVLKGYAARFNVPTDLGWFTERIAPGAFRRSLEAGADVRALWNHSGTVPLGRRSAGTLRLQEDADGLAVEIDPPESRTDVVEAIRRGDVTGMSFGFFVREDEWAIRDGLKIRTLLDVDLIEVSPVIFPAYDSTEISLRNVEGAEASWKARERMRQRINAYARRGRVVSLS